MHEYNSRLNVGYKTSCTQAVKKGFGAGVLESLAFISAAIGFSIGGIFVNEEVHNLNADREYRMGDIFGGFS